MSTATQGRAREHVIGLPWTKPPLSLNARQHHHVKAKETAEALDQVRYAIRFAKRTGLKPMVGANITLHLLVDTKRRRDADNLAPTLKVCQDALVLEGVLPDDSWVHVPHSGQTIHPPDGRPAAMWLTLEEL